jgi:hypothetical protein
VKIYEDPSNENKPGLFTQSATAKELAPTLVACRKRNVGEGKCVIGAWGRGSCRQDASHHFLM